MAFTFSQARKLSSEEANPMNALISRAMDTFGKGMNLSYLPREKEANIINKTVGPYATLASSPLVMAMDPAQRKQLLDAISGLVGNTGGIGGGQQQQQGSDQGDNSGSNQNVGNIFSNRTRQGLTKEQVSPGTVSYDESGNPVISPTGGVREDIANAGAGRKITQGLISKISDEISSVKKESGFPGILKRGALTVEGTNIPVLSNVAGAVVPPKIRTLQKQLEAALVKYNRESPESAHYAVQKHPGENLQEYGKRLVDLGTSKLQQGKELNQLGVGGIPLNNNSSAENSSNNISPMLQEDAQRLGVSATDVMEDAQIFNTTPEVILSALRLGIKDEDSLRSYIKNQGR